MELMTDGVLVSIRCGFLAVFHRTACCQSSVKMSNHWLVRNVHKLKGRFGYFSRHDLFNILPLANVLLTSAKEE